MKQSARAAYLLSGLAILAALIFAPVTGLADGTEPRVQTLSEGVKVESPSGGLTVKIVNYRLSWAPLVSLSRLLGTGPSDSQEMTFRSESEVSIPIEFDRLRDERGQTIPRGTLTLRSVQQDTNVSGKEIKLQGKVPADFVVTTGASAPLQPGTYKGDLLLGKEATPIAVTVQVRQPAWLAILFTLAGLVASLLVNVFRKLQAQQKEFDRMRRIAGLLKPYAPRLITQLLVRVKLHLGEGSPKEKELAVRELNCAELLLGKPGRQESEFDAWITKLDELDERALQWDHICEGIEQLEPTQPTLKRIYSVIQPLVQDVILGYPSFPSLPRNFGQSRSNPVWERISRLVRRWVFGGSTLFTLQIIKAVIILGAIGATVKAGIATYNQAPDFGSDFWTNYGNMFMVGYIGKEFNDFLQMIADKATTSTGTADK